VVKKWEKLRKKSDEKMIENLDDAVRFFNKEVLFNKGKIIKVFYGEKGPLAKRLFVDKDTHFTVFFKKSWNPYFGRKFRMPDYEIGQTTNLRILEDAANNYDGIGIVHPDTKTYTCSARKWLMWAREYGTIWTPKGEINKEASIPAELLTFVRKDNNNAKSSSNNNTRIEYDDYGSSTNNNKGTRLDGWM